MKLYTTVPLYTLYSSENPEEKKQPKTFKTFFPAGHQITINIISEWSDE